MSTNKILTSDELKVLCEGSLGNVQKVYFNNLDVPVTLHSLIPYVEIWGVADDWEREGLVQKSPEQAKENLKWIVSQFEDELDAWLAGSEASKADPSDAYIAFSSLRMAVDFM